MERQFVFTNELKFFEIEEKGNKRFFVKGAFSSTDLDLVNDICTQNCLESMVSQIKSGNIKLDWEHEAFTGDSQESLQINKARQPLAKAISAEINGTFAEATWELNDNYKKFDTKGDVVLDFKSIKSDIQRGFLTGFSIAYVPTKVGFKNVGGERIRLLDDVNLLNVALTGSPINTAAQVRGVFMKSMNAVEDYKTEKKTNPSIEDKLEVKAESGADREKRKIRKEATNEDDDGDEEEKSSHPKVKKKYEKKAYEKDGAHAHTEAEPLGLHNHPEIEERIRNLTDFLLSEIRGEKVEGKSHSNEKINNNYKEVKNMEETEKDNDKTVEEVVEATAEPTTETSEESEQPAEPVSEIKSMLGKMSKEIKAMKNSIYALEAKDEESVESPEVKVNSKAVQSNTQSQGIQAKSIAGLSELKY